MTGHLVFYLEIDFIYKARWVLNSNKTPDLVGSTYTGVVSRESVRIAFTYSALSGLDFFNADVMNTYLQATSSQKDCIIFVPEFVMENVRKLSLFTEPYMEVRV